MSQSISNVPCQRKILIVDDTAMESAEYKTSLEAFSNYDLDIDVCSKTSDLDSYLADERDVFIVDMMMPHGRTFSAAETMGGKFTGTKVIEKIRERFAYTPIILLSNTTFGEVAEVCKKTEFRHIHCLFWRKQEMPPRELAKKIDDYFADGKIIKRSDNLLKRIFGAVLLQPSFGGVGIDIKKVASPNN